MVYLVMLSENVTASFLSVDPFRGKLEESGHSEQWDISVAEASGPQARSVFRVVRANDIHNIDAAPLHYGEPFCLVSEKVI
mmetsp:Transcript_2829/g.3591  ORF Transcript_2829/g.3591 Transcript_2829/m.3591 type:complete len:81 (-) Transcript_2829:93-335(-)